MDSKLMVESMKKGKVYRHNTSGDLDIEVLAILDENDERLVMKVVFRQKK